MGYRADQDAQRLRVEQLEADLHEARGEIAELRARATDGRAAEPGRVEPRRVPGSGGGLALAAVLGSIAVALTLLGLAGPAPLAAPAFGAAAVVLVLLPVVVLLGRQVHVARPSEALVVTGRRMRQPDGTLSGFSAQVGGRVVRRPFVEAVSTLDLRTLRTDMVVRAALCSDGATVELTATALVKVASDGDRLRRAVERFLNQAPAAIGDVARATLESAIRSAVSSLTLADLDGRPLKAASIVAEYAQDDLDKLGLALVGFWVMNVADREGRLEAQTRLATAQAVRDAETKGRLS